uniref:Zinc knuckle CX2CX4HX4C domain-containing protein n=1 Tax=Quercus lobata TaxID=97700 RepID=A0A7N2R6A8_QUELO
MHARVSLDASLPLCSGRVISLGDDHQLWVSFKYKCLPNICYWCGCLDHDDKDCDIWIESEGYYKTKVGSSKAAFSGGTSGHKAMEQDSSLPPTVVSLEKETVILGKGC